MPDSYNILILGSGGREHALARKIESSPKCKLLFTMPGNAGTAECGENISGDLSDFKSIADLCSQHHIDIVVVGPEVPLVNGIVDFLRSQPVVPRIIVGPARSGARLEGSKSFAKQFMFELGIPTASYRKFERGDLDQGITYLEHQKPPIVLKADGLAAGKGVVICPDQPTAKAEFRSMLAGKFGTASHEVVVEEFLSGREFSVFALTDGSQYCILPIAKDYKRIGERDTGPNTGGMGCVSPVNFVDDILRDKVINRIIEPTIQGISQRKMDYKGFIFFGLIEVKGDPYVIEYNCRLGDPEAQVVLPRLRSDLVELFEKLESGNLKQADIQIDPHYAITTILASGGYPGTYAKGLPITGSGQASDVEIIHAGTKQTGDGLVTNGGRVMAVTALGPDLQAAMAKCQAGIEAIHFEDMYYRKDIGLDLLPDRS